MDAATLTLPLSSPSPLPPLPSAAALAALAPSCPACGWTDEAAAPAGRLLGPTRRVRRREALFHAGDDLKAVYAVRSGTFKMGVASRLGGEQVMGFRMAGDLLGLDAVAENRHATHATALEDSEVLVLPYPRLDQLAAQAPDLHQAITRLMSREIVREHRLMVLRASFNAEQRVAAFMLNLSRQMKERGYSATEFHLRMSRSELGSYLGMNIETVSRAFSELQHRGLLHVDKRHVRIADRDALAGLFDPRVH